MIMMNLMISIVIIMSMGIMKGPGLIQDSNILDLYEKVQVKSTYWKVGV